jgi:1,4-alpha-glucan branching enzyme
VPGILGRSWAVLLSLFVFYPGLHAAETSSPGRPIQFTLSVPGAKSVAVAGNFNGWSATANPMQAKGSDGTWSTTVKFLPGEYRFMYIINGKEWKTPPVADDFIDDGFGQVNGVLIVP